MANSPSYFFKHSNGTYYYRQLVPRQIIFQYPNIPKEIRFTLDTNTTKVAIRKTNYYWVMIDQLFNKLLRGSKMENEALTSKFEIERQVDQFEQRIFKRFLKIEKERVIEDSIAQIEDLGAYERLQYFGKVDQYRHQIALIKEYGQTEELNEIRDPEKLERLYQDALIIRNECLSQIKDARLNSLRQKFGLASGVNTDACGANIVEQKQNDKYSLEEIIPKYFEEKTKAKKWTVRTRRDHEGIIKNFIRVTGVKEITKVDRVMGRKYKDYLIEKKNDSTTINKHLTRISAFFDYALTHAYIETNPIKTLRIETVSQDKQSRDIWSKEKLEKLFQQPEYQIGGKKRFEKSYHYWLPILGLMTGARLGELCQLEVEDVRKIENIWCISINDNCDKKIKNKSSIREVPIHSKLIQLGFLDFVKNQQKHNHSKLFPEYIVYDLNESGEKDYSRYASRWFSTFLRQSGLYQKGLVFHSFRHTFSTLAKQSSIPTNLAQNIIGHRNETLFDNTYANHAPFVRLLKKEIEKIDFGVDFSNIVPFSEYFNKE